MACARSLEIASIPRTEYLISARREQQEMNFKPIATNILLLSIVLFLNSCTLISELAPTDVDTSHIKDWIAVPVFYATNRQRASSQAIDFSEQRAHKGLRFGVKNVVVPAPELVHISKDTMKRMGWEIIHLDKPLPKGRTPALPPSMPFADKEYTIKDVVKGFDQYRADSGSKRVIFFVHGCCATFQASLERSAKIASHMQIPLVVYDWDSPKGFTKYLENETLVEQTTDDFYSFLNAVEAVVPPANTTLISHSMGARFFDAALLRRAERMRFGVPVSKYEEVIFSQPDTDARAYIRHNKEIAAQAEKTRIYFNRKDGRLDASATAHGFERLGRPGILLERLCKQDNQEMMDITQCAMGHEIPFWVLADVSGTDSTAHPPEETMKEAGYTLNRVGANHFEVQKLAGNKD